MLSVLTHCGEVSLDDENDVDLLLAQRAYEHETFDGIGAKPGTRLWERLILPFVKGITTGLAETWECRSSRRACTNVFSH